MTFIVSSKKNEIGIRKVYGAGIVQVVSLITKEFIGLVLLAFIIAAPFVYYFLLWKGMVGKLYLPYRTIDLDIFERRCSNTHYCNNHLYFSVVECSLC